MTFKTRNAMLLTLFIFSLALLVAYSAVTVFNVSEKLIAYPTFSDEIFAHIFLANRYEFKAVFASIFVFLFYIPITSFFLFLEFEKTHSTEVIFFTFFLIGCLSETARLLIPLFNLWNAFSLLSIFIARTILFGRILSPLSLLFLTTFSDVSERQYVERNIVILLIISVMATISFPLNTMVILPSFCMQCGDEKLFFSMRLIILFLACASFSVKLRQNGNEMKNALYFFLLAFGYFFVSLAFSFGTFFFSSIVFILGTIFYLKNLHIQYLWK